MAQTKEQKLAKLRKEYDDKRVLKDEAIDYIKKIRHELAKYTFADLDGSGKNPYFTSLRKREKRFIARFKRLSRRLNDLDHKIDNLRNGI